MTINNINTILSQLENEHTRENVLAVAFALLEWMGVEPNPGNKPQLLSPQTQKLKDFLATAPQTVQPQLYRLSADNQNIRVRFAVLKKLKKDYVSQLVDNDPGLGSYQSFVKGLTNQGQGFVPAQPYFIHFVTTPAYDKLVIVFNQGEQKRVVTFRNRLTNTQYNRIILQWQGVGSKSKPEIADLLWKSLDIKEVNKEFYKQIKERFDALLGIVRATPLSSGEGQDIAPLSGGEGQGVRSTENQIKQFTVRLIGRYIFCWFLKEKGIIPPSLISKETIEATDNYYQNVLLKLFFETLNTKVQDRNPLTYNKLFEKIPYLNGGLFDESEEDRLFAKLELDDWLRPFVGILESYDFTVDESSSQYQQVAVDPEMLGRIFENLLASQNEETEKLANQRKAFGAFYTPREIVDYMVNESLKAYLQTQLAESGVQDEQEREKKIAPLLAAHADAGHLKKEDKNFILKKLEQIKILDPACGSGAFPMGILHKLVELNEALGTVKSSYELKKDILSHNIYGVDIMPMAIEIARLRAWLSLVLEEEYKPNDPKHNFGLKPLPNLDFKFVCANSLIDIPEDEYVSNMAADALLEFEKLTEKYFAASLEAKERLKDDIKDCVNRITEIHSIAIDRFKLQIRREEKSSAEARLKKMKQRLTEYERQHQQWQSYKNIFDEKTVEFFNTKYFFPSVKNGFDVVIGNPPYVSYYGNTGSDLTEDDRVYFAENYKSVKKANDRINSMNLMIERGISLLKDNGHLSFIVNKTIAVLPSYVNVRKYVLDKAKIEYLVTDLDPFEAIVDCVVLGLSKGSKESYALKWLKGQVETYEIKDQSIFHANSKHEFHFSSNQSLLNKIELAENKLEDLITINRGVNIGGCFDSFLCRTKKSKSYWKYLSGTKNIDRYSFQWSESDGYMNFDLDLERTLRQNGETLVLGNPVRYQVERLFIPESGQYLMAAYCNEEYYSAYGIMVGTSSNSEYPIKYACALLNSGLFTFYAIEKEILRKGKKATPHVGVKGLNSIPVHFPNSKVIDELTDLVDKIIQQKSKQVHSDTTDLENQINLIVYKLYALSYEEVKIIDPHFWLSEAEYNKVRI
jgi:methylase of polypeptide subunit release factors